VYAGELGNGASDDSQKEQGAPAGPASGFSRWYPAEAVTIERPGLCPTGACDLGEEPEWSDYYTLRALLRLLIPNSLGNLLWGELVFLDFCVLKPGSAEVSFVENGSTEVDSREEGFVEEGSGKVGSGEVSSKEEGFLEEGSAEVGSGKVGFGTPDVGSAEVGFTEVRPVEVNITEVGSIPLHTGEISTSQANYRIGFIRKSRLT